MPLTTRDSAEGRARKWLTSILNRTLRITTTDNRLFWGRFKCTDPDSNIVLTGSYEYRPPTRAQVEEEARRAAAEGREKMELGMTSRYLGIIVVPGEHILKIELEEVVVR